MRLLLLTIAAACCISATLSAQGGEEENRRKALELGRQGIAAVDAGNVNKALDLLKQAEALDPHNPQYRYEQAYVYVVKKEYATGAAIVETLLADSLSNTGAADRWYQLLANCYDYMGDSSKAVATYQAGLQRFPDSGPLHLELGVMAVKETNYDKAISYWEQGIRRAPTFPSNYYWAARLFCNTSERMWGLIYGEIFMNLEPGSRRTQEISRLLYTTYRKAITIRKDSSRGDFMKEILVRAPAKGETLKMPLSAPYVTVMMLSTGTGQVAGAVDSAVGLADLNAIRTAFVKHWFDDDMGKDHSVVLFEHQKNVRKAGHLEAYNYWLLSQGNPEEFETWASANEEKFRVFIAWLRTSRIEIDTDNVFVRGDHE